MPPLLFARADVRQWLWEPAVPAQIRQRTRARHRARSCAWAPTAATPQRLGLARLPASPTDRAPQGILPTTAREFDGASEAPAAQMRALGCDRQRDDLSADEAVRLEPAARHIRPQPGRRPPPAEDEVGRLRTAVRARAGCACCRANRRAVHRSSHTVTALCAKPAARSTHVEDPPTPKSRFRRRHARRRAYVLAMGGLSPRCWPSRWASGYRSIPPGAIPVSDAGEGRVEVARRVSLTDGEYKPGVLAPRRSAAHRRHRRPQRLRPRPQLRALPRKPSTRRAMFGCSGRARRADRHRLVLDRPAPGRRATAYPSSARSQAGHGTRAALELDPVHGSRASQHRIV